MTNANRQAAIGRIKALLAKTVTNGCTEQEAMAAATKAGELMDRYSLSMSDVEIKAEKCATGGFGDMFKPLHDVRYAASAIGRFCGCRTWFQGGRIEFFGLPQDIEVAKFLVDLVRNSIESAFKVFLKSDERPIDNRTDKKMCNKIVRRPFMVAMAQRVGVRLNEMSAAREATAMTSTGTSLVVVRNAVVNEQYKDLALKLRAKRSGAVRGHNAVFAAGRKAGDRVNLTTGIGGSRSNAPLLS